MRATWWWIDRWRKSTAFTDMSLAQQGAYRNLLDEVVLRPDGIIPASSLARASGDAAAWPEVQDVVLKWMRRVDDGWTNDTGLAVKQQATDYSTRQREKANKRWSSDSTAYAPASPAASTPAEGRHASGICLPSPSPSPSQTPSQTPNGNGLSVADATGRSTASRARRRPLFGEEESKEAAMLVKGWVYLVAPNGKAPPPSPGIIRAVATLQEAGYSKPQRALAVVAASTERYYSEMRGLRGLQVALSLGGRPRLKDGLLFSVTKNHPEGLLNEPRRYSQLAEKVLVGLGAMDEATARGWRPE